MRSGECDECSRGGVKLSVYIQGAEDVMSPATTAFGAVHGSGGVRRAPPAYASSFFLIPLPCVMIEKRFLALASPRRRCFDTIFRTLPYEQIVHLGYGKTYSRYHLGKGKKKNKEGEA